MGKKTTLSDIAKIMDFGNKKSDSHYWGRVESTNTDSSGKVKSYNVALGDGAGTVTCRKLAGAKAGDTVMVTLRSTGEAIVTGTVGGDTDASDAQTTADNVQTDLDENYSTTEEVEEMIATLPSGAKIYYQASAPEGTFKVGDTWFDTDDGYKIYKWTGSAWEAIQFGSSALAADSVTASQIAAGAVTASEIAAGAVTAAKITAGAITVEALNSAVKTSIENAAKTATNYLSYDSTNGLVISQDASASSLMSNAQLTSSGLNLRYDTDVLAEFKTGETTLGFNASGQSSLYFGYPEQEPIGEVSCDSTLLYIGTSGYTRIDSSKCYIESATDIEGNVAVTGDITATGNVTAADTVTAKGVKITNTVTCSSYAGLSASEQRLHKYSASARRFKENFKPLSEAQKTNIRKLYDTEVLSWKYKDDHIAEDDDFYGKTIFGLIAEDAVKAVPELEQLDENGEIENYKDRLLLNAMLVLIQEQHEDIEKLKAEVKALKEES